MQEMHNSLAFARDLIGIFISKINIYCNENYVAILLPQDFPFRY
jgi:hypothetical protein